MPTKPSAAPTPKGRATLTVYTLANCDTCRRATGWLRANGITFDERAIRETPPSRDELRTMLSSYEGEVRRLFNTSGRDYRAQQIGSKLPNLSEDDAIALLAADGRLVKRPFVVGASVALVGFDERTWAQAFRVE